jgi:hypothetical protein
MFPHAAQAIRTRQARFFLLNMHPLHLIASAKATDGHREFESGDDMHISCKSPEKEWNTFIRRPICNISLASKRSFDELRDPKPQ